MKSANSWLHGFAWVTGLVTLGLIGVGGLVTSNEAGMSVPDWPNSYGYNMFLFPVSKWAGGILYEHTHRLIATILGVLVVALTRWLGGNRSRLPLAIIGAIEVAVGLALPRIAPELKAAGLFLSGIGSVVVVAAVVWVKNQPAARPLPVLGWLAFWGVQVQGLLGGLRVVLSQNEIGIFHAALAQAFFVLVCGTVVMTSRWWIGALAECGGRNEVSPGATEPREASGVRRMPALFEAPTAHEARAPEYGALQTLRDLVGHRQRRGVLVLTMLIFGQLLLGATMRHQHAGLAIPDFPLAYGKVWPAMDAGAVQLYNQQRMEAVSVNPITGFQVGLQMAHRILALIIFVGIAVSAWRALRKFGIHSAFARLNFVWLGLVLCQATLGAATIWSNKAADVATAHVVVGALLLANGTVMCLILSRSMLADETRSVVTPPASEFPGQPLAATAKS